MKIRTNIPQPQMIQRQQQQQQQQQQRKQPIPRHPNTSWVSVFFARPQNIPIKHQTGEVWYSDVTRVRVVQVFFWYSLIVVDLHFEKNPRCKVQKDQPERSKANPRLASFCLGKNWRRFVIALDIQTCGEEGILAPNNHTLKHPQTPNVIRYLDA